MYEKINREILEVKERVRRREKILSFINHADDNLKNELHRKDELKKILSKEELDVKKLEGLSIKGMFITLLGNKEEKLDKEKAEFLAAKLKYDSCCGTVKSIETDLQKYYGELREIGNANDDYEKLMRKKEQFILNAHDINTRKILDFAEERGSIEADLREIKQAIMAGNSVLNSLERAADALDTAENWGTYDMFGGGIISSMEKHSSIDEAVDYINDARDKLDRFRRELSDVNLSIDVTVDISSFDKFADYFFDGIFADWNVQSKIEDSQYSLRSTIYKVQRVIDNLKVKNDLGEEKLRKVKENFRSVIEKAED
ncbi:hypothetical protein JK636_12745 [Clostridium sp. YIM B02515]|uniref:Uncharacterized protein n=1 Tax=Clostridium rhizosphaerae TaxID=2803861 RepID=A0ABS1TBH5_9CLOT|nr:hypothetical protein [Clostridium rhizosphaerae]MBL4936626.1 hypothetical protein [Clostridium rhizosphaerae]